MTTTLVERLRIQQLDERSFDLRCEAADRIEELERQLAERDAELDRISKLALREASEWAKALNASKKQIALLREALELYEQAMKASWPDGAVGDAFDYWNAARKVLATEEKK